MSSITPKPGMTVEISMQGIEKSRLDAIEAAESLRKANEAERADAELMRKEGETGRITAEQERTMEEDARNLAESGRILAEESRVTAENLRSNGEQSRAEAEKGRSIAESGRANAEQQRVESEEMRENAEAARVTAETARANAEALRQQTFETNEANRHTAFESAESARESEWTEIKSNVETSVGAAVADAEDAAQKANSAAESANAASEKSVRYDEAQTLDDAQKAQARGNIDAADAESVDALKGDFSELPIATVTELISKNGFTPTGASGISKDGNTITGTVQQNGYVVFAQEPITFKKNDIGRKFKVVLDVNHSLNNNKTFTGCSFLNGSINNWSAVENFTVRANENKHIEAEYVPSTQGNLCIYCYGGVANVNITCKIYDITDISSDMLPMISFDTLNTVKYIHATISDKSVELVHKDRDISCWGDSLTYGYGATHGSTDYPTVLANLTGKVVHNFGVSGEDVAQIMARQGGYYAKVNPFTIPADTTATEITYTETINTGASVGTKLGEKGNLSITNPVDIGGVKGNISYTDSKFYFSRLDSGQSVEITRPTPVIPHNSIDRKDDIQCIFVGTNGGWMITADDAETRINKLISEIDLMIDHCSSKEYIVIGMHYYYSWILYNGLTIEMVETALQRKYGNHYINLRKYMVEYGLADANITPTSEDSDAIAQGNVPPSLLASDKLHGNDKFYNILANLVYKQGEVLGYW